MTSTWTLGYCEIFDYTLERYAAVIALIKKLNGLSLDRRYSRDFWEEERRGHQTETEEAG